MHPSQRIFLIVCAVFLIVFILRKIRKSQMQIEDSVFWVLFALSFVILAIFPQIMFFVSDLLHFESPSNMVFLYVVGVLVIREFSMTAKVAKLRQKTNTLAQQIALDKNEARREIAENAKDES